MGTAVNKVALLDDGQIDQFKRDGFLVLPGVLDPDRCSQARDEMWDLLGTHFPRMKREDPETWHSFKEEESLQLKARRPKGGGEPIVSGSGSRLIIRNGAGELMLNLAPRSLWDVAEQLCGEDTLVWPKGLDGSDTTTGPCFMCDGATNGLSTHLGDDMGLEESFETVSLALPRTGPVWMTGQGTRGLYCTLPDSPDTGPDYPNAHSDGPCYDRLRLQMSAYIDDVPAGCGGFTVWPGSHSRIWEAQWEAYKEGEKHTDKHLPVRKAGGYTDPVIGQIKQDTEPVDCHGPAGTVVLWHTKILHVPGRNASTNVLRQATIYGFLKTKEALPDMLVSDNTDGDVWRDWAI